ncbi:MAG: hypothetical protein ACRD4W_13325, partial [Nitrososphaeraceae archaeon]
SLEYPFIHTFVSLFETNQSVSKQGKGSPQFPLHKPIPYWLANKIVIFRVRDLVLSYPSPLEPFPIS